ncbi:hypothetical protein GP486_005148 [Trichoglossum hirsutum]|uniref:Uncharacterized protein n=1 Tax=Trichoglossum hirsutum TaxID=265104 RepID=A0A9P8L9S8_9PEZI|nr:hypothetical protein GP486_005148 [Trichoglossum hirsutum]
MSDNISTATSASRLSSLSIESEHGGNRPGGATIRHTRPAALAALFNDQVLGLEKVFQDNFKYNTKRLKLNIERNPQQQLNLGIGNFVLENDGEYNLLIIYYAGHGVYDEKSRHLYLDAAKAEPAVKATFTPRACWHKAETCSLKEDIHADVLTILDCCFAGDVDRSSGLSDRTYELLAANGPGETTPQPGPHSFTNTLISVLSDIAKEKKKINTFDLRAAIARRRDPHYQPLLLRRISHGSRGDKHIKLAPLCGSSIDRSQELEHRRLPAKPWEFHIQFTLEAPPTDDQIKNLAKELPVVFKEAGLCLHRARWTSRRFEAAAEVFVGMLNNQRRRATPTQGGASAEPSPRNVVNMRVLAEREAEAAFAKLGSFQGISGTLASGTPGTVQAKPFPGKLQMQQPPSCGKSDMSQNSADGQTQPSAPLTDWKQVPAGFIVGDKVAISERIGNERHSVNYVVEEKYFDPGGAWVYLVCKDGGEASGSKWVEEGVLRWR